MHKQSFDGIAHRRILHLGVVNNVHSFFDVRGAIDVNVANPLAVPQNRNPAVLHDVLHQLVRAARNNQVHVAVLRQKFHHVRARLQQADRIHRNALEIESSTPARSIRALDSSPPLPSRLSESPRCPISGTAKPPAESRPAAIRKSRPPLQRDTIPCTAPIRHPTPWRIASAREDPQDARLLESARPSARRQPPSRAIAPTSTRSFFRTPPQALRCGSRAHSHREFAAARLRSLVLPPSELPHERPPIAWPAPAKPFWLAALSHATEVSFACTADAVVGWLMFSAVTRYYRASPKPAKS